MSLDGVRSSSEFSRAESRLRYIALEQTRMLAAAASLFSMLSHEIKQPLAAAGNYVSAAQRMLELAENESARSANARETLVKATGQIVRVGTVMRALRDSVELPMGARRREDWNRLVEETMNLLAVDATVRLMVRLSSAPIWVCGNRDHLQAAVANLLDNAVEALAGVANAEVTIVTAIEERAVAVLNIMDNGSGIAESVANKLFEPLVSSKPGRLGLGLAACRTIMRAHDGDVQLLEGAHTGTAIQLRLPLAQPDP